MDTIKDEWRAPGRIGKCIPTYDKDRMIEIEDYIIEKCKINNLTCKYNVGVQIGGIPPKGDDTAIVNPSIHAIRYHDMLGGLLISTRNAELNCRNVDNILYNGSINNAFISDIISQLSDKYSLDSIDRSYDKVVFLPGSNIRHIVDIEKVEEILYDNPSAMVKPHPIQTQEGLAALEKRYKERLLESNISGYALLNSCSTLWSTANSEIGLMAALLKKPFGDITIWRFYYELLFSFIYRQFMYKNTEKNYNVITKFLSADNSGYIAPWRDDWRDRVDSYFDFILQTRNKGDKYPYIN